MDATNAFNMIKRSLILKALKFHFPELIPFFLACYGDETLMFFSKARMGPPLPSSEGVAQGDTLALFYFCLALTVITEATRDRLVDENIIVDLPSYADNLFFAPNLTPMKC